MQLKGNAQDLTFLSDFSNWKDTTRCFHKHETTVTHKEAVEYMVTLLATTINIGGLLSFNYANQKQANSEYLFKVIQNIKFLTKQGLALQGDGNEWECNFMLLLQLWAIDDSKFTTLERKSNMHKSSNSKWNFKIMYLQILRSISSDV